MLINKCNYFDCHNGVLFRIVCLFELGCTILILGVDKICTIHHFQLCQNLYRYVCLVSFYQGSFLSTKRQLANMCHYATAL